MNKIIALVIAVVILSSVLLYAEPSWVNGIAIFNTDALNGWTITCGGGTYGSTVAAINGGFGLSWELRPPAGYYYLTADTAGPIKRYSGLFYYDGSSYGTNGTWYFSRYIPE
ncbi:hypothetical protein HZA73_03815 [candidate division TA06 bacterium]|nr:hypothetical protein [candidate division TA06 bacterium]